jgi:predicted enzyme related to lactoylglutathione lyase
MKPCLGSLDPIGKITLRTLLSSSHGCGKRFTL